MHIKYRDNPDGLKLSYCITPGQRNKTFVERLNEKEISIHQLTAALSASINFSQQNRGS